MKGEVLSQGDDRADVDGERPRRPGRLLGALVAVALLALGGTALRRDGTDPPAERPTPTPSAAPLPGQPTEDDPPVRDAFAAHVTVPLPPPGVLRAVLLPGGVPGFLVPDDELPTALAAVGGPEHSPVLVGWCAATETFVAADGQSAYDTQGNSLGTGLGMARHALRRDTTDRLRVDVGGPVERQATNRPGPPGSRRTTSCPDRPFFPTLPAPATRVHDTARGHRVLAGRYVVTTETRAFCDLGGGDTCAADGWEVYRIGSLPLGDLAGSYTWEGRFLVRGALDGSLSVIRLPGTRLVRRERVGSTVLLGLAQRVRRTGNGPARLTFNPFRHVSGQPADPDPLGAVQEAPEWSHLMADIGDVRREYPIRPDVEVILGLGQTGLGRPRGTARTLERFLRSPENQRHALWVVLDARGRVLRVAAEPKP